jgi:hypothetical protein
MDKDCKEAFSGLSQMHEILQRGWTVKVRQVSTDGEL